MARYYPRATDDLETVARNLLDQVDDHRTVIYLPGEGPIGAFEIPDDLDYTPGDEDDVGAERREQLQAIRDSDALLRVAPQPHEPTTEDLRPEGQKTNVVRGTYDTPAEDSPPARTRGRRAKRSEAEGE